MHPVSDAIPKYSIPRNEISGFIGCARLERPHKSQLAPYLIFSPPSTKVGGAWTSILPAAIAISLSGFSENLEAIIVVLVNLELGAAYLGLQGTSGTRRRTWAWRCPEQRSGGLRIQADPSGLPARPDNSLTISCQPRIFFALCP
jgi:hypothetical protein